MALMELETDVEIIHTDTGLYTRRRAAVKLRDLLPDPKNANKGTPRGRALLEDSLRRYGAGRSLLADKHGVLIAGNKTAEVAADIGLDNVIIVPTDGHQLVVVQRTDLDLATDPAAKELAIADNRTSQVSLDWDVDVLQQVAGEGVDLSRFFTNDELDALLARDPTEGLTDPDAVPEERPTDIVRGDLFALGEHRLLCGDSTSAEDVAQVMDGQLAQCIFTDPPYNVAGENTIYASDVSKAMAGLKAAAWDHGFEIAPALEHLPLAQDVSVYICTSHHLAGEIWTWMKSWADHFSWCVWDKPNPMPSLSKRHWTWNGELIPYATRGRHVFNFPATGHAPCIWRIAKAKETDHPTEKVVGVPVHAIEHSSTPNQIVFDGFLGSGTTLIACEQLQRRCYAIEIEPRYVQVAIDRWEQFTGKKAQKL